MHLNIKAVEPNIEHWRQVKTSPLTAWRGWPYSRQCRDRCSSWSHSTRKSHRGGWPSNARSFQICCWTLSSHTRQYQSSPKIQSAPVPWSRRSQPSVSFLGSCRFSWSRPCGRLYGRRFRECCGHHWRRRQPRCRLICALCRFELTLLLLPPFSMRGGIDSKFNTNKLITACSNQLL